MNVETVKEICDEFGSSCYIHVAVRQGQDPEWSFNFFGLNRDQALEVRERLGLGDMAKLYRMGDEDWRSDNVTFNAVEKCKVVGYREEEVPAHTKKIPIYECPGGE